MSAEELFHANHTITLFSGYDVGVVGAEGFTLGGEYVLPILGIHGRLLALLDKSENSTVSAHLRFVQFAQIKHGSVNR